MGLLNSKKDIAIRFLLITLCLIDGKLEHYRACSTEKGPSVTCAWVSQKVSLCIIRREQLARWVSLFRFQDLPISVGQLS